MAKQIKTPEPRALERERLAIADILGEKPEALQRRRTDWLNLMQQGVIVELHIRRWRATRRMRLSDLGLAALDERGDADRYDSEIFNIGEKILLPPEMVNRATAVESRGRKNLERYSFGTYWGAFIAASVYDTWKKEDRVVQKEYFELRDEICENYAAIQDQMKELYRTEAEKAYGRLKAIERRRKDLPEEPEFIERFVGQAIRMIPDQDDIYTSWQYEVDMFYIPLPSLIAEDNAEAKRIEAEATAEIARIKASTELEVSRVESRKSVEEAQAEKKRMASLNAAEMRKEQLERMNRDVVEKARKRKEEEVDRWFAGILKQLRSMTYTVVTEALESIEGRGQGKMGPRTVVSLRNLIAKLEKMNFTEDRDITEMTQKMKYLVNRDAKDRSDKEIVERLRDIAVITRAQLITLGEEPSRSARKLGLADKPAESTIRKARTNLGLADTLGETSPRKVRQLGMVDDPPGG